MNTQAPAWLLDTLELLGRIDFLGYLFLAGSLALLWAIGAALIDDRDLVPPAAPEP